MQIFYLVLMKYLHMYTFTDRTVLVIPYIIKLPFIQIYLFTFSDYF